MAVYEVQDEKIFRDDGVQSHEGAAPRPPPVVRQVFEPARFAYTQIWPMLLAVPFVGSFLAP